MYGGENIKNYVQYPENEDKTKNLWRIIGSYQIDNQTLPKLISQSTTSTSTSTLTTDLTSFYNTLEDKEVLVQQTNKFNCFTSTCAESTYNNIGLLTDYEYNQIGGVNSYLATTEKYYINSSSGIKEVTSSGITNPSNTSGLKPTIYLQTGVQVTGSGTASDPYIISPASDINLVSYTLNGQATNKTYADLLKTNVVKNVTCKNGTTATWDNTDFSIKLKNIHTPDYCTIDFGDGYSVSLTATNGTVSPSNITVGYNGTATFTVKPNSGYKLELETNNCGGTLSGNTYTISNITSAKSCSITFKKNISLLATLIQTNAVNENGYRYEGTDPNNYIQMEKIDGTTEMWRIIGLFPDGANGEDIIRVRKVGYEKAAYDSTNKTNHWPKTTLYTTLSSTYSLTNYKNTVNYKMYLGGASSVPGYTSQDLYDMERMLNSKGTAGKTSQDSYSSTTTFTGSVGLMYPSDYGYAVLASDCARNIQPYNYDRTSSCYINNWLFQGSSTWQWAISPNSSYANSAFHVLSSGLVFYNYGGGNFNHMISFSGSYSPVMALKSDVYVTGSGTQSDPYVMQ